jgi:hypothetical protein
MKLKRSLLTLGLSLCAFSSTQGIAAKDSALPLYTPFNWATSAPSGYILKGTVCTNVPGVGTVGCNPVTIVNDPQNNRFFLDLGAQGGQYYLYNDASYIYNAIPGVCTQVPNFTYQTEATGYETALSYATKSDPGGIRYMGRVIDVAGCKDRLAVEFLVKNLKHKSVKNQIPTEWNYSALYPIQGLGCPLVSAHMVFDVNNVDFKSNRDSYFASMPTSCNSSAASFCEIVFPPGNPCEASML